MAGMLQIRDNAEMSHVYAILGHAERCEALQATLGEGPVWHDGGLWCVDIESHRLHRIDPAAGRQTFDAGQRIGMAVPTDRRGVWAVGLERGLALWEPESGRPPEVFHDPEPDRPGNRFNDGKTDPCGRLFAGTMDMACRQPDGSLYRVDAPQRVTRVLGGVTISNGLAWDTALNTMYYVDTPTQRIDAFDWDAATGEIASRRTLIDLSAAPGGPDGMCIDSDGRLWVAMWGGGAVMCIEPPDDPAQDARIVGRVTVDAPHVTSCCFGGADLKTLYITTARAGMSEEQLLACPHAGDLFAVTLDRAGLSVTAARLD